jgi:Ni/Fe-hydrogenase 1 B-type cytochrome subunit
VLLHWTHLLSMLVLGFTGFFIHSPFLPLRMDVMRELHFVAMYVVLIALAARVWYAFAGRSAVRKETRELDRDYRNFAPQPENRGQLIETVRYYLFLRPTHPRSGKYNPLQKSAYLAIGGLLLLQAYTGFALYGPAQTSGIGPFFAVGTALVGGLMAMREIHYFIMWGFILITLVHVYLSVAEDAASVPLMFFWRERAAESETSEELRRAG